jgi:hypothetical protein
MLSRNPNAIHILEKHLDEVNWSNLSDNPNAIHILEKKNNLDKVNWNNLSSNPNAIPILEQNLTKVNWFVLFENPNIFTYDYKAMKDRMFRGGIMEDLMKERFDPENIDKFNGWGFECPCDDELPEQQKRKEKPRIRIRVRLPPLARRKERRRRRRLANMSDRSSHAHTASDKGEKGEMSVVEWEFGRWNSYMMNNTILVKNS